MKQPLESLDPLVETGREASLAGLRAQQAGRVPVSLTCLRRADVSNYVDSLASLGRVSELNMGVAPDSCRSPAKNKVLNGLRGIICIPGYSDGFAIGESVHQPWMQVACVDLRQTINGSAAIAASAST